MMSEPLTDNYNEVDIRSTTPKTKKTVNASRQITPKVFAISKRTSSNSYTQITPDSVIFVKIAECIGGIMLFLFTLGEKCSEDTNRQRSESNRTAYYKKCGLFHFVSPPSSLQDLSL